MSNRLIDTLMTLLFESIYHHKGDHQEDCFTRIENLWDTEYWNGRGFDIEEDFKDSEECKIWYHAFYELAEDIFERRVGDHKEKGWQKVQIYLAISVAELFLERIRVDEPRWYSKPKSPFLFPEIEEG